MHAYVPTRGAALFSLAAIAAAALSACNTPQTAAVPLQPAAQRPAPGVHIGAIQVDTAPLLAQVGNPTASWAQQALSVQLAQTLASRMAPGDPGAATLTVSVDSIYLGQGGPADPDSMKGMATLSGSAARQIKLRATSTYIPSPVDQTLVEQALHGRVSELSQSFAYRLKRRMGL